MEYSWQLLVIKWTHLITWEGYGIGSNVSEGPRDLLVWGQIGMEGVKGGRTITLFQISVLTTSHALLIRHLGETL